MHQLCQKAALQLPRFVAQGRFPGRVEVDQAAVEADRAKHIQRHVKKLFGAPAQVGLLFAERLCHLVELASQPTELIV
jgi:hypothetical protein